MSGNGKRYFGRKRNNDGKRDEKAGLLLRAVLYFILFADAFRTADLFIIGKYGSVADITSVSIGSQVMHMLTVMIVGLAMGATVTIGRFVGADNKREAGNAVGNTVTLFTVTSLIATVILYLLAKPICAVMSTPAEAVNGAVAYLRICFLGIPFITAYNVISSVFRGMGDSKTPMYFVAAACAVNIGLDLLFMGVFAMGPAGAALGTTLSQTASVIIAGVVMKKSMNIGISVKKSDFLPRSDLMGRILRIGVPIAVQDGLIQVGFVVITIIANLRGLDDAAAVGVVEKFIGIVFLVPSSFLSSISALAAQNIGAGKPERAKKTLYDALLLTTVFGIAVSVMTQFCAEDIVRLFKDDPEVVRLGGEYLRSYVIDCVFAGIHFCFSGYFCALGRSELSFIHNMCSVALVRIPVAYFASINFPGTLYPMGWASALGSLLSVAICVTAYAILNRKKAVEKLG